MLFKKLGHFWHQEAAFFQVWQMLYEESDVLTRGPVILRIWYSSSLYAMGTLLRTHLQRKILSLGPSMPAAPGADEDFSKQAFVLSVIFLCMMQARENIHNLVSSISTSWKVSHSLTC